MKTLMLLMAALLVIGTGAFEVQAQNTTTPSAYMSFVINTHDWIRGEDSADIILKLIELFEQHGIHGDFYLTDPVTRYYAEHRPDVLERLCNSNMTISYHVRPPHPLNQGFDQSLQGLDGQALYDAIYAAETQRLDLATGRLIPDEVGGYRYVAEACGRNPVALGIPNGNPAIRAAAMEVYTDLGAQMIILEHEVGAELRQVGELWSRPSDFSVTRWTTPNQQVDEAFWWNMLDSPHATDYDPIAYLTANLEAWTAERPAYVTSLIHENNFYWQDSSPWDGIFTEMITPGESRPLRPPFDLDAPPVGSYRSAENQALIWETYAALVSHVASQPIIQVVTSADIVQIATAQ